MSGMIFGVSKAKIYTGIGQTLYMISVALLIGIILSLPVAFILFLTRKGGLKENKFIYGIISGIVNVLKTLLTK